MGVCVNLERLVVSYNKLESWNLVFLQSLKKLKVFACQRNPGMDGDPDLLTILAKFLPDGFEVVRC